MDGVELVFDIVHLSKVFHFPIVGLVEYVWTKDENSFATVPRATGPVAILLNDLHAAREQNATILAEIETLRTN
ncbi:hypothetical protein H5410_060163 [Solanum commersonii]|uniref:Uncharacterized protein n=1 Tax=Solanum commersonii TaxID=4109 RepID=A0A9J5W4C3_SOLCO|nr:hypothetical protein H5410_060163 [Solanum commersonii]